MKIIQSFLLAILYIYIQTTVVEYQKVTIGNWKIDRFPKHIVIKTFFANLENELYANYVKSRKHPHNKGIPLRFEFKEMF